MSRRRMLCPGTGSPPVSRDVPGQQPLYPTCPACGRWWDPASRPNLPVVPRHFVELEREP